MQDRTSGTLLLLWKLHCHTSDHAASLGCVDVRHHSVLRRGRQWAVDHANCEASCISKTSSVLMKPSLHVPCPALKSHCRSLSASGA